MPRNAKKKTRTPAAPKAADWMEILRLDKKKFDVLFKKVNLTFDENQPIPDPTQRLSVSLRYLVTGEGYHESLAEMLVNTYSTIFNNLQGLKVRPCNYQ